MAGLFAKGTTLWVGNGASPEIFSKLGKVKGISGPGYASKFITVTTQDSAGYADEVAAVGYDSGDVSFPVNWDPADATHAPATGLISQLTALAKKNFQLRIGPADTLKTRANFAAFVSTHPLAFPVDNVMEANVALKIDGDVTWDTVPA